MPIPARLQTVEPAANRRSSPRHQICLGSNVRGEPITIHDLSVTGMLIETAADLHAFDSLEIGLPEVGATTAFIIWNSGRYFGCEFKEPVFPAAVSAARLRSPPAVPVEVVQAALPFGGSETASDKRRRQVQAQLPAAEEKASLSVRLRVIFGSAVILWALVIWAVASLVRLVRGLLA